MVDVGFNVMISPDANLALSSEINLEELVENNETHNNSCFSVIIPVMFGYDYKKLLLIIV